MATAGDRLRRPEATTAEGRTQANGKRPSPHATCVTRLGSEGKHPTPSKRSTDSEVPPQTTQQRRGRSAERRNDARKRSPRRAHHERLVKPVDDSTTFGAYARRRVALGYELTPDQARQAAKLGTLLPPTAKLPEGWRLNEHGGVRYQYVNYPLAEQFPSDAASQPQGGDVSDDELGETTDMSAPSILVVGSAPDQKDWPAVAPVVRAMVKR